MPYEDLVMSVYRAAKGIYIENVFGVISVTLDELAQTAFTVKYLISIKYIYFDYY